MSTAKLPRAARRYTSIADFSDLIDNVDTAFMGLAVLSYNRFVLYADYDYLNLTDDAKTKRRHRRAGRHQGATANSTWASGRTGAVIASIRSARTRSTC